MITVTAIQNAIQFTGEGLGMSLQCGLYNVRSWGTNNVQIYELANPKVSVLTSKWSNFNGAVVATSQIDCVGKLGKLLSQNTQVGKVFIDGNDTTLGYLFSKIVAGSGISFTIQNIDGNESILISATGGGGYTNIWKQVTGNTSGTYVGIIGTTGKTMDGVQYDGVTGNDKTWSYDNTTDTLTVGTKTVKLLTIIYH